MTTETGNLIRERREQKKLSQTMVAKYVGFTSVFLARVESGMVGLPPARAEKLARILDLEKDEILKAIKKDMNEKLEKRSRR